MTLVALTVWRLAYYGDPLPNTVYAKVTGDFGGLLHWAGFDLLVFLTLGSLVIIPPIFGLGSAWLLGRTRGGWTWVMVGCLLMFQASTFLFDTRFRLSLTKRDILLEVGDFMAQQDRDGSLIAIDAAGKIPFESELPALDMLGLNDRFLAHGPAVGNYVGNQKFNPDYVLAKQPKWIVGVAAVSNATLDLTAGLVRSKYLAAGYEIRFLTWNGLDALPTDGTAVIDVKGMSADQMLTLVTRGYGRLILEKP